MGEKAGSDKSANQDVVIDMRWDFLAEEEGVFDTDLVRRVADKAVASFSRDRLQSYFLHDPYLAYQAWPLLKDAKGVAATSPRGAVVLAAASIEVTYRKVFLEPLVHGFTLDQGVASAIASGLVQQRGLERSKAVLTEVLKRASGVDLLDTRRKGATESVWKEMQDIQALRDRVMHQGVSVAPADADRACAVAEFLLVDVLWRVVDGVGLDVVGLDTIIPRMP